MKSETSLRVLTSVVIILLIRTTTTTRACKLNILRSFELTSRVIPNQRNILCPKTTYNCCSEGDQLKMHKMWGAHGRAYIKNTHKKNRDALDKAKYILLDKEKLDVAALVKKFKKIYQPSPKFNAHLDTVVGEWSAVSSAEYKTVLEALKKELVDMHRDIYALRRGFLCSICEYSNQQFISHQSHTVVYSEKFCKGLYQKFAAVLARQYNVVIHYFIVLNELIFLLTGEEIMDPIEKARYKRYSIITARCEKKMETKYCADVCKEFNLNEFSYLWDGQAKMIDDFKVNYETMMSDLMSNRPQKVFRHDHDHWTDDFIEAFAKKDSVVSKINMEPMTLETVKKNRYHFKFNVHSVPSFLEKKTPSHTIQVDGLDDELDSFKLFKMAEPPMDISKFKIMIKREGIDLFFEANGSNLEVKPEQFLALLHAKGGSIETLDEVVEDDVVDILKKVNIEKLKGIINDYDLQFSRFVTKRKAKDKPKKERSFLDFLSNLF